ncbi:MAG: ROK family protein [Actinobacteria bacterium]|nr:ROK family protein [Actinomycetota bacterium]
MTHSIEVLEALRRRPVASRAQLVEDTGLSAASISRTIAKLRAIGLAVERVGNAEGVGRPPRVVQFQPAAAHVIGIDAGGSRVRVMLTDLGGVPQSSANVTVRAARQAGALLDSVAQVVRNLVERARARPVAAAAGISGIVDAARGEVLLSPDLPALKGRDVAQMLSERLGLPVAIDNDDLLAAAGEAAFGAAEGCTEVVFLSLGFGVGAGLIVGGRPVRGARSSAGAIAYLAPGRLEERASGRAIPVRYAERRKASRATAASLTAERVFELAAQGDEAALAVVADAEDALGDLVVNVAALLDPQVVVLGGGLVRGQPSLVGRLGERLRAELPFPPRLAASALGEHAVARGAASLALTLAQRRLAGVAAEPGRLGALEFV